MRKDNKKLTIESSIKDLLEYLGFKVVVVAEDRKADRDDMDDIDDDNDYYGAGYSDGEYDCERGGNYNDGLFDNDEYARGYADGWDDAEARKMEEDEDN